MVNLPLPQAWACLALSAALVMAPRASALTILEETKEVPMQTSDPQAIHATLAVRLRFLLERMPKDDWDRARFEAVRKEITQMEEDLAAGTAGKSILSAERELLMGYRSDLDDSDQPYRLWIPEEYDGSRPFPLVVDLHGQGMFKPLQCHAGPVGQMIVVAPQGRGGMDYMYVGEGDVLRVIEEVQRLLKIDPDRIYLAGASMGGEGSWHLASKYPDRFAGIMALCGNTDINVWAELWHWRTPKDSPLAAVRQFLREDTCAITYVENLHNVKIIGLQGEADAIVNQLHALHMREALKACGHPNYKFHILPYVTHHFAADYSLGLEPMLRDAKPRRVRYKTAWLKYPGAYWLKITGLQQRLRHASVDGLADQEAKTIAVTTENVSELEIDPQRLPFAAAPARITLDGTAFTPPFSRLCFQRAKDGAWQGVPLAAVYPLLPAQTATDTGSPTAASGTQVMAFPPKKNARIEGPLEHAFMSRFVLVTGEITPQTKTEAQAADDFVAQWKTRYNVPCRRKTAAEITPEDIRDSNLILFGTPQTNPLVAQVAEKLPLSFEPEGVRFNGKLYRGPNLGAMLCYPNPLNPERYMGLLAGTTPESYLDINVRFGNWFDWVPYDFRKHYDFAIFDDLTCGRHPESFLVWGFFGDDWRCSESLTFSAVPAWREKLLPRVIPAFDWADKEQRRKLPDILNLDAVYPSKCDVTKEYLERNRTLEGTPLQLAGQRYERGLCGRFPCALTFNCEGYSRLRVTAGVLWDGVTEPCADRKKFELVKVLVLADNETVYEAHDRTYRHEPCVIDVELKGAKTVTLSASGGLPWLNGSFVWADGKLERNKQKN